MCPARNIVTLRETRRKPLENRSSRGGGGDNGRVKGSTAERACAPFQRELKSIGLHKDRGGRFFEKSKREGRVGLLRGTGGGIKGEEGAGLTLISGNFKSQKNKKSITPAIIDLFETKKRSAAKQSRQKELSQGKRLPLATMSLSHKALA